MFVMISIILILMDLTFILIFGAYSTDYSNMNQFQMMTSSDDRSGSSMMMGHGHGNISLQDSTGENELIIPPILKSDKLEGNDIYYTIEAQKGKTELFKDIQTET